VIVGEPVVAVAAEYVVEEEMITTPEPPAPPVLVNIPLLP
jgi:hypothetical protein